MVRCGNEVDGVGEVVDGKLVVVGRSDDETGGVATGRIRGLAVS